MQAECRKCGHVFKIRKPGIKGRQCNSCRSTRLKYFTESGDENQPAVIQVDRINLKEISTEISQLKEMIEQHIHEDRAIPDYEELREKIDDLVEQEKLGLTNKTLEFKSENDYFKRKREEEAERARNTWEYDRIIEDLKFSRMAVIGMIERRNFNSVIFNWYHELIKRRNELEYLLNIQPTQNSSDRTLDFLIILELNNTF